MSIIPNRVRKNTFGFTENCMISQIYCYRCMHFTIVQPAVSFFAVFFDKDQQGKRSEGKYLDSRSPCYGIQVNGSIYMREGIFYGIRPVVYQLAGQLICIYASFYEVCFTGKIAPQHVGNLPFFAAMDKALFF